MRYSRVSVAVGLVLVASLVLAPARSARRHAIAASTGPNIVLILTDDQRWDTLWAMPHVQSELIAHGVTFTNAFVVNALCCPSRATILTGQYSHSTQVYGNAGAYGGFESFDDSSTVARWLQRGGYHTGLIGKYLNKYDVNYIPPGWDRWVSFVDAHNGGAYYNYTLTQDGTLVRFGHQDADYSTDVLAAQADSFIRTAPSTQPFFLYFSVYAPHYPSTPATKYETQFQNLPPYRPPSYNEADVTDKPRWVQDLLLMTEQKQESIDNNRKNQYRTLLSVDDAVGTIVAALTDTQRLGNTLIAFASDNGWSLGEHRWNNKKAMWEESIRVPEIIRYDPLTSSPRSDDHLVANVDLAPTFAAAAGVTAPGVDGLDMMPLLADPQTDWRHDLLVEHLHEGRGSPPMDGIGSVVNSIPTFCGVRDDSFQPEGYAYVVYDTGEEELYDLKTDFYELTNVAADEAYLDVKLAMRDFAKQLCDPVPPGFDWPYEVSPLAAPGTRR